MMNHSGCLCLIQRQRHWHACSFSEKSRFLWDMESSYFAASFSLVTEMIQHPFDIRFGFEVQHIHSYCVVCCPRLGKLRQEWNQRALLHVCHGFCWLLSPVQTDLSRRYVQLCSPGSATFAGISPLLPTIRKERVWAVIRYLNCLHIACPGEAGLDLDNGVDTQVARAGKLPAPYSTCSPNPLSI